MFPWSNTSVIRCCCTSSISLFLAFICSNCSLLLNWGISVYTRVCCRVCHFCQTSHCVRFEVSIAQPNIELPINEESTQYCRLCLPSLIVAVDLVRMTRSLCFSWWIYLQRRLTSNICFQLRIRFPKKQVVPKLELKHNCLQIAAKAHLPEYTTNPIPIRPIVQCQIPSVLFTITNCRPSLHGSRWLWIVFSATCRDSDRMRLLVQYFSIAGRTRSPVVTSWLGRSPQLGLTSQLSGPLTRTPSVWGGHYQIGRTSTVVVDICLGGHCKRNVLFIVCERHVSS